jgi:long-chain acyl-CoA synthetase
VTPPATLNQLFLDAAPHYAGRPAVLRHKHDGRWIDIPYDALKTRVANCCAGLRELGLARGDRVGLLSENRPEWAVADYACLAAGLVDVPIYATLPASQVAWILRDAGATAIFVATQEFLDRIREVRSELPALRHIIVFDDLPAADDVISMHALEANGSAAMSRYPTWEAQARAVTADELATLIYTSGTTGEPKGVMLSHGNITSNVIAALQCFDFGATDSCLSFLPLCHAFERMVGHYTMLHAGAVINYATNFDTVAAEMMEVRPTLLASVPRLYEKIHARAVDMAHQAGGFRHAIFEWAVAVGDRRLEYVLVHQPVPGALALQYRIADALVFARLRQRTGGRIRFLISGGAPLAVEVCRFLIAAGLPVFEGYGLTETSPVVSANTFAMLKPGTVGRPIPGVEVRVADDGEILVRGPNVMQGYFHQPEATAQVIDADHWFHTGDIGEIDSDGCLRITDRKKDLIKTSGGKYVAPQMVEGLLRTNKFFANAVMLGDKHNYPIMLLVPDFSRLEPWLSEQQIAERDPAALVKLPAVTEKLEREARKSFRDLAQFETPKRFLLLPQDFTIASGELTPTLKVKRRVVEERYRAQIDALYADARHET